MNEPKLVRYADREYTIVLAGDKIGVVRGCAGKVYYMPVVLVWNGEHVFPKLCKTRLSMVGTAAELAETLVTCSKIKTYARECIIVCEHILKYGHGVR